MNKHSYLYLLFAVCSLLLAPCLSAQTRVAADGAESNLLGGGGSNYSKKDPSRLVGRDGLRTGQYTGEHHLIGLYGEGAYSSFINNLPHASFSPGGYGAGGGFVYEYQHNGFLFQIGLGARFQEVRTAVSDTAFTRYNVADSWTGVRDTLRFDLHYNFFGRTDYARNLSLQVPILFGQQIVGSYGMGYYLLGVDLDYLLQGTSQVNLTGTTTATYHHYLGTFQEMDNHGLRKDVPVERTGSEMRLRFDLLAHAEIGYEYGLFSAARGYRNRSAQDVRLRLGAFVQCGLFSLVPDTKQPFAYVPDETRYDFPTYRFSHIFTTAEAQNRSVHNFFVGLRFTVLYGVSAKEKCIICGSHWSERNF